MASSKKASSSGSSETKVTRVVAKDTPKTKASSSKKSVKATASKTEGRTRRFGSENYFKGAWYELRQVRWPDRQMTWGMTGALLAFTAVFVLLITMLDAAFKYLFDLVVK